MAYSPLGRGFLTGEIKFLDDLSKNDIRGIFPRFQPDVFGKNLEMAEKLQNLAKKKGCSPA